jgi:hypothetical protein
MTDTSLTEANGMTEYEGEVESTEDSDIFYDIYVETQTNLIHEVQLFEDFALVRPASPNLYLAIRKLPLLEFSKEFHEYLGDCQAVRDYLKNSLADIVIE